MRYYDQARLLPAPPQEWIFELRESTRVREPRELLESPVATREYDTTNESRVRGSPMDIDHDGWIAVEAGVQATAPTGDGVIET
jgi:hypothetical protein